MHTKMHTVFSPPHPRKKRRRNNPTPFYLLYVEIKSEPESERISFFIASFSELRLKERFIADAHLCA